MLDFRIHTFLTLYKEMNYRRTAEILNMTQPGVTQHIHYLENHYGVKLFEYNGRTLSRSKNAEILKRHIDSMAAEERAMRGEFAVQEGSHLDVGATKTIGEFVLAPIFRQFLSESSHTMNLVIDNTETLLHMLENSELDFAVVEGIFDKSRYGYHLFKKESFVGICSAQHRFAGQNVTLDETFRESLIVREPGSGTRRLLEQAILNRGFSFDCFQRTVSVSNFSVISDMVKQNHMITFAYRPVALGQKGLAVFEVEDMHISGEFNFVYCNKKIAEEKIKILFEHSALPYNFHETEFVNEDQLTEAPLSKRS